MRFHVVGLPHTQTIKEQSSCAYTQKIRRFASMMYSLGHTVYLYAGEENDADCTELVTIFPKDWQRATFGETTSPHDYAPINWDMHLPQWGYRTKHAIEAIRGRLQPQDFICFFDGNGLPIQEAFPNHQTVEAGIGYSGTFARYRVFESYAWMHAVMGFHAGRDGRSIMSEYGQNYDEIIYNSYEPEELPFVAKKDDYFAFVGRMNESKGYQVAEMVCQKIGARLVLAGQGDAPSYGEYRGLVGPTERGEIMAHARAVFVPSLYLEPFGGVHAEALLCGTPVITSDWGAFSETVTSEVGFRCRTLQEFVDATTLVNLLNPVAVHDYAVKKFSTEVVKYRYQAYFNRLLTLWEKGWYTLD